MHLYRKIITLNCAAIGIFLLIIVLSCSCDNNSQSSDDQEQPVKVNMPEFNIPGGVYTDDITVSLNCDTAGAKIYYTTDSTTPDILSTQYISPINITEIDGEIIIRAIAVNTSMENSEIISETYQVVYNRMDLSDWYITQVNAAGSFTLPADTLVRNGGYLIIGREADKDDFESFWGVTLGDKVTYLNSGGSFPGINGSEYYTLYDDSDEVVDGPSVALPSDVSDDNCQRITFGDPGLETSWTRTEPATPGSGAPDSAGYTLPIITEFSDASGTGNYIYEFIEIYIPEVE